MTAQYIRTTDGEAVEFENEWLILHADQHTVTKLNEVGGVCWSILSQPSTIQTIAAEVQKRFDITELEAESDIERFLTELLQLGLAKYENES